MQLCSSLNILWHCLSLGLKWKLTFSSPMVTAEFSKFADILSTALQQHHLLGIPSPPLALFIVMLPKAHLTLHSRMSGSRWVISPSWLYGSLSSFFLELFLYWSPVTYWASTNLGSLSFSPLSLCLFILFMGFSRQEYWNTLSFPSPVDHVLSELSTLTHPSWVALYNMA